MFKYVNYVLSSKDRKSIPSILKEMIHCGFLEREVPYYYFTSLLFNKNSGNYKNFIGRKK